MKQVKCKISVRILTLIVGLFLSVSAFAQSTIKGIVKDSSGEPIISASVLITGTHDELHFYDSCSSSVRDNKTEEISK